MQPEHHDDSEEVVNGLEHRLDRLRSLYEMYFAGVEKRPPDFAHKEVVRIIYDLEKRQIKNTGVKFKLRQLVQKFNSYRTYWTRTCRQIEEGTYKRLNDRIDAKRKHQARLMGVDLDEPLIAPPAAAKGKDAAKAQKPAEPDIPVFAEEFEDADPHSAAVAALESWSIEINIPTPKAAPPKAPAASQPAPAQPVAAQPVAARPAAPPGATPGPVQFGGVGMGGRLAPSPAVAQPSAPDNTASRPGLSQDEAAKADALRRKLELLKASSPASRPGGPSSGPISRPTAVDVAPQAAPTTAQPAPGPTSAAPEGAKPAPRLGLAAQAALQGQPRLGSLGGLARPASPSASPTAQPATQPATQPMGQPAATTPSNPAGIARPGVPPARPTVGGIARPSWGAQGSPTGATPPSAPSTPPSAPSSPGGGDAESRSALRGAGISEQRLGEIHRNLVQAKQQCNEPTQSLSVDNVARLMAKQLPTLREKYGSSAVDFEVVVKEGKTYLKPKTQK
jgi:hypothetical protein